MRVKKNSILYILLFAIFIGLVYLLAPILTPFIMGFLLAYLANPLVKKLEKWGVPHLLSVTSIFLMVIIMLAIIVSILIPLIQKQIAALVDVLPQVLDWLQSFLLPWINTYLQVDTLQSTLTTALPKTGWIFSFAIKSGHAIIAWIVNIVLIPVVMFYLLRDWNKILMNIKGIIPQSFQKEIVQLIRECDEVLSAFFRGQLLVMLALCLIYGIGLTLVGLRVGLMVGIIGGLLSIIPFLGSAFVLVTATIITLVQSADWHPLIGVLVVYVIGQIIEGYILTPYLIGERIGLHPVMVIFAIMAGGTLFGFFGVLVALPAAAIIKVLLSFIQHRYQKVG